MSSEHPVKRTLSGDAAKLKIDEGVSFAADIIGMTMGPKGQNVAIVLSGIGDGKTIFTKDGVSVAGQLKHPDAEVNIGVDAVVEASKKTNDEGGDGTTCTVVLADAMLKQARDRVKVGGNPILIQKGMEMGKEAVLHTLKEISKPIESEEELFHVAYVSSQDEEIAKKIADIIIAVGKYGTVGVESYTGPYHIEPKIVEGMHFDYGFEPRLTHMSAADVGGQMRKKGGDAKKLLWENDEVGVLLFDEPVRKWDEIAHIFSAAVEAGRNKLFVVGTFDDDAAQGLQTQMLQGVVTCCTVNRSVFMGDTGREILKDIAIFCGARFLSPSEGTMPSQHEKVTDINSILGSSTASIGLDTMSLVDGAGDDESIDARVKLIEETVESGSLDEYNVQLYRERIARFRAGIGTITIFAPTELQQHSIRTRVDDAVSAVRSANEEGVVPGGGVALLRCYQRIQDLDREAIGPDVDIGVDIVQEALKRPLLVIAEVSGDDPLARLESISAHGGSSAMGYDYWTEQEVDLLEQGIIDPTKVVRLCVENAVSVVGELLRIGATMVPIQGKEEPMFTPRQRAELAHAAKIAAGQQV